MATTRDILRLKKFDGEILELNYLYEREVEREKSLGKRYLLKSRELKYKLDNMVKARNILMNKLKSNAGRNLGYLHGLDYKKHDLKDAEGEYKRLQEAVVLAGLALMNEKSASNREKLEDLTREMQTQKGRVGSKKHALEQFMLKRGNISMRQPTARLPRGYDPNMDADSLNEGVDLLDPILDFDIAIHDGPTVTRGTRIEDTPLARDVNWTPVANAMTSAIDMLNAGPATKPVIDIEEQEVEDDIVYDDSIFVKTTPKVQID